MRKTWGRWMVVAVVAAVLLAAEPVFAADDGSLFTVTGRDLISFLIAVIAPVGAIGIWMGKLLLKLNDSIRDLAPAVASLAKEQEKCEADRKEIRQEIRRVENVGSERRGEMYRHFEQRISSTPAVGFPPIGGPK